MIAMRAQRQASMRPLKRMIPKSGDRFSGKIMRPSKRMIPKSGDRFSGKIMRPSKRMIPKSGDRFSDEIMRSPKSHDGRTCAHPSPALGVCRKPAGANPQRLRPAARTRISPIVRKDARAPARPTGLVWQPSARTEVSRRMTCNQTSAARREGKTKRTVGNPVDNVGDELRQPGAAR
jgi:hypothetical protein